MQVAVTGTYTNGQVVLDETPPVADDSRDVMVVFLPKNTVSKGKLAETDNIIKADLLEKDGLLTIQELGGVLSSYCDGTLSDMAMNEAVLQGALERAMMDNNNEL